MQATRPDRALDLQCIQGASCVRCPFFTRRKPSKQPFRRQIQVDAAAADGNFHREASSAGRITRRHSMGLLGASVLLSAGR